VSTFLLILSGYLSLVTTQYYSVSILAIPFVLFVFMPLAERLDRYSPFYRRITRIINVGYFLFIPFSLMLFPVLTCVIALVIYIQAYTLFHRKEIRNYYHLFLMSFFLVLAACALLPDPEIGPVLLLFLVSAIVAFMTLQLTAELAENTSSLTADILSLDAPTLPSTSSCQTFFDAGLISAISVVSLAAVGITIGLFFLRPRMEAGIFGRRDPSLLRTGVSQTVDLTMGGRITLDRTPVMRVEFPDEPDGRYDGMLLWRTHSLEQYEDSRWMRRPFLPGNSPDRAFNLHLGDVVEEGRRNQVIERVPLGDRRIVHQMIYSDDVPDAGLPCLTLVQRVAFEGNARDVQLLWDENRDFTVLLGRRGKRWLQYDVWSEIEGFTKAQLQGAPDNYTDIMTARDYVLLTEQDLEPRTVRLAEIITADSATVCDKAIAIALYLNGPDYSYTLNLPLLPLDHPMDAFIHETKAGHCELFASAMALMLRSLGIPTRVASGYRGGDWSPADRSYTVRADMAHLWVEVYFPGVGWVSFDPTPPDESASGFAFTRFGRQFLIYILRLKMFWYQNVINFDRGLQIARLHDFGSGIIGLGVRLIGLDDRPDRPSPWRPLVLLPTAVLLVVVGGVLIRFRPWVRAGRREVLTEDQARAVRLYRRLQRRLKRFGIEPWDKTAEELCAEACSNDRIEPARLVELIGAYNEVRFGRRSLPRERYKALCRLTGRLRDIKDKG